MSNFQRARRSIASASDEQVTAVMAVLPTPSPIPADYVPPSTFIANGPTWSILIDNIAETFVFLDGYKRGDDLHAGQYLEFIPEEWLTAFEACKLTRPEISPRKDGPYTEVAFADSPNGDEGEGFPIPAPQWQGGSYRYPTLQGYTPSWASTDARRSSLVHMAEFFLKRQAELPDGHDKAIVLATIAETIVPEVIRLLGHMVFLPDTATPAVNPVCNTDDDEGGDS